MTSAWVVEWSAIFLSLKVGLWACLITLVPGFLVAWLLARKKFWGHSLLSTLVHAPLVLPPVAVGYLLLLFLGVKSPVGQWLDGTFGFRLAFTTSAAVLSSAVMGFPLMVRGIKLALEGMDQRLEWVARSLGAKNWDVFFTITLPLTLPGVLSGTLMTFATSLGEFGATITFASNIEGVTRTLPLAIYTATQIPNGDAIALRLVMTALFLALVSLWLAERLERRVRSVVSAA